MDFEWDPGKAASNRKKHGVGFEEARTIFADPLELTISDPDHSHGECRFLSVGRSELGRVLVVSYTEREPHHIRIITARPASRAEQKSYESRH
jgi:uncharacterized protein